MSARLSIIEERTAKDPVYMTAITFIRHKKADTEIELIATNFFRALFFVDGIN